MTSFQNFFSSSRNVATRGDQFHRRHEFTFQRLNDLRRLFHRTQTRVKVHSIGILASAQAQLPFVVCTPGVHCPGERESNAVTSRGRYVDHGLASDIDRGGNAGERHVLSAHVDAELPELVAAEREDPSSAYEHQRVLQTQGDVDDLLLLTVTREQLEQRRGVSNVRILHARGPHTELPLVVPSPDVHVSLLLSREVNNGVVLVQKRASAGACDTGRWVLTVIAAAWNCPDTMRCRFACTCSIASCPRVGTYCGSH